VSKTQEVTWRPQAGPQTAFVHCTWADEVFFGGARGGGKTDAALGKLLIKALQFGKGMRGIFFRRTYKQLEEVILRAKELYSQHGATYKESSMTFTFPNGAWVKLGYLDRDADADNYQGKSHTDIVIEEAGTFPSFAPIAKLKATLRSAKGIPCQLLLTGNPGGPGANWIRARYIDPNPAGWTPIKELSTRKLPDGSVQTYESTRIYIPSRVTDNQILMQNDPNYIARLMDSGSEQLVRAWLEGDFYVVDGAFFDNFDTRKHVLRPCELPDHWTRYRAADWGSAKPFCNLWIAVASEDFFPPGQPHLIPKGALVVYREWYGVKMKSDGTVQANVGLKLFAEEFGRGVLERERGDRVDFGVMDPSAFASDGGPSIAERVYRGTDSKVMYRRADNKRVGTNGAMSGWDQIRGRLGGEDHHHSGRKDVPMLFFFNTCVHTLRTLPMLQHDADRVEDIDTEAEDHAADALRYGCMARPYIKPTTPGKKPPITTLKDVTLDYLWQDQDRQISHSRRL
jgi:hypothetical protein